MKVTKEQVQWYFQETFTDHWETITDFLNSKSETKAIMIKDIQEQTKNRSLYRKEICLECRKDTSYGSDNHVNRIPCGREEEDGWLCEECQLVDCHKCNALVIDYECVDNGIICRNCFEDIGSNIVVMFIEDIIKKYAGYFGFKHGSVKPEYDGDFLELLELLRGVTYVESRGNGWAVQQGFEK